MAFRDDDVPITMTGEEWFALLAKFNDLLTGKATPHDQLFSRKGRKAYASARAKLDGQLLAASSAAATTGRKRSAPAPGGDDAQD
jgi:hypothetical protein